MGYRLSTSILLHITNCSGKWFYQFNFTPAVYQVAWFPTPSCSIICRLIFFFFLLISWCNWNLIAVLICIFPITGEVDHNAILCLLASLCSVNFHSCVLPICFYFDYFPFSYNLWEISSPFYGMYSFHL